MRLVNKAMSLYRRYRFAMWASGVLSSVGIPLAGYGLYAFDLYKTNRLLSEDNPELASSNTAASPLSFMTGHAGWVGGVVGAVLVLGVILMAFLAVLQIVLFVGRRTKLTGPDDDATEDGNDMDDDDMDDDYQDGDGGE